MTEREVRDADGQNADRRHRWRPATVRTQRARPEQAQMRDPDVRDLDHEEGRCQIGSRDDGVLGLIAVGLFVIANRWRTSALHPDRHVQADRQRFLVADAWCHVDSDSTAGAQVPREGHGGPNRGNGRLSCAVATGCGHAIDIDYRLRPLRRHCRRVAKNCGEQD